jgi:hypothetical protein
MAEEPLPLPSEFEDEEQVFDVNPDEEVVPTSYDIASYGADYPVDGLVKRMDQADVVIPSFDPAYSEGDEVRGFQRRFVWSRPQMDKFIESLLLGLPVPGVFLVREKSNRLIVLDGQQRLRTLQSFYSGLHSGLEYRLKHVQPPFVGRSYRDLEDEDRRRLDDSVIHATVLRQEHPAGSQDAIYSIYERLNTGGSPLQPQEIRVALYSGPFLRLISELNTDHNWRTLYGPVSDRFKDQELILRVLALYEWANEYARPVKGFLNHYLAANRTRDDESAQVMAASFREASRLIQASLGPRAFRPVRALNAAVLDSVMVGLMRRLDGGRLTNSAALKRAYDSLFSQDSYMSATTSSTAAEDTVKARLNAATKAFARVK